MRIGLGYDVHKLTEDRKLIIGGVEIPHDKGLLGHSDADVLIHAIMDSIFGAIKSNFEDNYDNVIFITGFIGNAILAILLTYIGEKLGVSLYYVAVLVFGMRLFNNLSIIRRYIISNIMNKKRKN